jgi:cyclase
MEVLDIPITVMGGAGTLEDIGVIVRKHGIIGAAAGSLFVFKGKFRAVLINYPTPQEKEALLNEFFLPY